MIVFILFLKCYLCVINLLGNINSTGQSMKLSLRIPLLFVAVISAFTVSARQISVIDAEKVNEQCLTKQWQKQDLEKLKNNDYKVESAAKREALALQLLSCLASPDPQIRDGVAFEALSFWLRNEQLSQSIHLEMFNTLTQVLAAKVNDPQGVYQSFAMLVLSEVARVDRKSAFLNDNQRSHLVNVGTRYLSNLTDYRGFSGQVGWRHGIAHSSDLMLQLALNPAINKTQLNIILTALATQVTAKEQHSYTQGEPKRLAMAVIYVFLREELSVEDWNTWLSGIIEPAPFKQWQNVYQNEKGLIKLHNTQSFLYALYVTIRPSKNEMLMAMLPNLEQAIKVVR